MAELSRFFGIVISIYYRDHPPPHVHIRYGDDDAAIDIRTGRLIPGRGRIQKPVARLVHEWVMEYQDEIFEAWDDVQSGRRPRKIPPLR